VSALDFLTGLHWSPQDGTGPEVSKTYGAVPLFWGTIFIGAIIAMIVAIPLGLMSAIFLTQYASPRARLDEADAGNPRRHSDRGLRLFRRADRRPMVRDFAEKLGMENPSTESALAAGLVMGIMIIPFVSSMADDSIAAVPSGNARWLAGHGGDQIGNDQEGAGARRAARHRCRRHAGDQPRHRGNHDRGDGGGRRRQSVGQSLRFSMTTVTYQIVQLLTGDQEFDSAKTLSAFALGLVLFVVTLVLNIIALRVVKRFREAYE
jgi:phosphate transport system permease protein